MLCIFFIVKPAHTRLTKASQSGVLIQCNSNFIKLKKIEKYIYWSALCKQIRNLNERFKKNNNKNNHNNNKKRQSVNISTQYVVTFNNN